MTVEIHYITLARKNNSFYREMCKIENFQRTQTKHYVTQFPLDY